jgi:uncharacterized MnhB-related membrane protein
LLLHFQHFHHPWRSGAGAMTMLFVFDVVLGLALLWLAWQALSSPDLFRAIVLFIAFGLLMALAWVRLDAPDVALAEATIGAGLTGALLLATLARLDACKNIKNSAEEKMKNGTKTNQNARQKTMQNKADANKADD